ncbi:class II fumarate hydratase [Tetragenococcus koreensis]|nr:class II fumarate hydratase [Tetragenococcus koreensis]AYW45694.1 class II fumarate hydratase [Tetragenococcus koreensis]MCF1584866.1 class II fumarate hydratase [Tetragenococcus koreensis]MCF1614386.1 class II fumarate hydratase [Tetragenococcus koreensis]MCF1616994.1 class II fumarate hydratase [Tetragenococcus koreensis]MCF1621936.1 class II fumarate hydratase [Tetragenococcus koreensis]
MDIMTKNDKKKRIENDSIGPIEISSTALWGPQTERSRRNFTTGEKMPLVIIKALLQIKKAAAQANSELGELKKNKAEGIIAAIDQLNLLSDEHLRSHFPLVVYQTGSGTHTNMNVNEVVAHLANQQQPQLSVLPNDDVNKGQSSNDLFATSMNVAAAQAIIEVKAACKKMIQTLTEQKQKYWDTVKIGRTHLQDATPVTFGQELSGYQSMLVHDLDFIEEIEPSLHELAIGATAVGTGVNAHPKLAEKIAAQLSVSYQISFTADMNKFYGLAAHSQLNAMHGVLKTLAADLMKIANDLRFLASGPRAGYGELSIPANEPGSSIMPGKVNPTQAEALTMAAARVIGNDTTIAVASSQGNFEMNVYKPVLIMSFLESANLLAGTIEAFTEKCLRGLQANESHMKELVDQSLMLVTALAPHIGYDESAKIAQKAEKEGITLKEAALSSGKVSSQQFAAWVKPLAMTHIEQTDEL